MALISKSRSTPPEYYLRTQTDHPSGTVYKYPISLPGSEEVIEYESGPKTTTVVVNGFRTKVPLIKYCNHQKVMRKYKAWNGYTTHAHGLPDETYSSFNWIDKDDYSPVAAPTAIENINDFVQEAFNEMRPKFKGDTNVLNFIYELREVYKFVPALKNIRNSLDAFHKSVLKFTNFSSKVYSEANLNLNYGILPLLSDLETLNSDLLSYNQKLYDFRKRAGTLQKRLYRKIYTPSEVDAPAVKYTYGETYNTRLTTSRCIRVMTMYYYYNIIGLPPTPPLMDLPRWKSFKTQVAYHGLRAGAAAQSFWNGIPFSFLIDYVVRVGDWLGQLDLGAIDIELTPLQVGYSERRTDVLTSNMVSSSGTSGTSSGSAHGYKIITTDSYYRTRLGDLTGLIPSIDPYPQVDSFDLREQMLTLNLINTLRR